LNSEVLPTWGRPMIPVFIGILIDSVSRQREAMPSFGSSPWQERVLFHDK